MSFIPVKVEIAVGEVCIGILPVRLEMNLGVAYADMFRAECVGIKDVNGERECLMDFAGIINKNIWVRDYRITDFTFGGVMVHNTKFDPIRIDSEDEKWLKKNLPKKPMKTPNKPKVSGGISGGSSPKVSGGVSGGSSPKVSGGVSGGSSPTSPPVRPPKP